MFQINAKCRQEIIMTQTRMVSAEVERVSMHFGGEANMM